MNKQLASKHTLSLYVRAVHNASTLNKYDNGWEMRILGIISPAYARHGMWEVLCSVCYALGVEVCEAQQLQLRFDFSSIR